MTLPFFEQLAGLCVLTLILVDIFATVLYARAGSGVIAVYAERVLWPLIRSISTMSIRIHDRVLSFGGPLMVVAVVAMWFVGLSLAAALVIHPALGTGVQASNGETPTSFIAALFAGGSSVSIVGSAGFEPGTDTFRLFYWLTSLAGTAVTTSAGYTVMVQWASSMANLKETHHFYPVLCYFRFTDPRYSMARTALITLEAAALIRTALAPEQYRWVHRSVALEQLERSAAMLLNTLAQESHVSPGAKRDEVPLWKHRFASAIPRLREAGLHVSDDVEAGAAEYVRLRAGWDAPVNGLADFLGYTPQQIDVSKWMPAHGKD